MKLTLAILAALALAGCATTADTNVGGDYCTHWNVEKQRCNAWTIGQMKDLSHNRDWVFSMSIKP